MSPNGRKLACGHFAFGDVYATTRNSPTRPTGADANSPISTTGLPASEIVREAHYIQKPSAMRLPIFHADSNPQIQNALSLRHIKKIHTDALFLASHASPRLPYVIGPGAIRRPRRAKHHPKPPCGAASASAAAFWPHVRQPIGKLQAVQAQIASLVDRAHAAFAQLGFRNVRAYCPVRTSDRHIIPARVLAGKVRYRGRNSKLLLASTLRNCIAKLRPAYHAGH
jgi:hypothetical protein